MSYLEHFRRKVIAKLEEGYSIRVVSASFEIDKNTILSWKNGLTLKELDHGKILKLTMTNSMQILKSILMIISMSVLYVFSAQQNLIGYALKRLGITVEKRPYSTHKQKNPSDQHSPKF
ncbi:Transposase [Acinetobacter boissieri]|uniref:Transposase n=1 Tax=Acinetobacter boissieri TaxID=1219383 RepID=A0A1G6HUR2_9GAMM|nr:Transposase [Acinetobacter boissieri]